MKTVKNKHKVGRQVWTRWTPRAQCLFNAMYETMLANQELFLHPQADKAPKEQWTTTAWNASWTAADVLSKTMPKVVVTLGPGGVELGRTRVNPHLVLA